MKISIIAAMAKNGVIGNHNSLPWHLPADLQYFKQKTLHKPIIMGRKNYESIGRPLPNRQNIIITRNQKFSAAGCIVAHDFDTALKLAGDASEVMVIGGAEVYKLALPLADKLYLTFIDAAIAGDVYFPQWDPKLWQEISRESHPADAKHKYAFSFVEYKLIS